MKARYDLNILYLYVKSPKNKQIYLCCKILNALVLTNEIRRQIGHEGSLFMNELSYFTKSFMEKGWSFAFLCQSCYVPVFFPVREHIKSTFLEEETQSVDSHLEDPLKLDISLSQ